MNKEKKENLERRPLKKLVFDSKEVFQLLDALQLQEIHYKQLLDISDLSDNLHEEYAERLDLVSSLKDYIYYMPYAD